MFSLYELDAIPLCCCCCIAIEFESPFMLVGSAYSDMQSSDKTGSLLYFLLGERNPPELYMSLVGPRRSS